jgi:hypothetical protein
MRHLLLAALLMSTSTGCLAIAAGAAGGALADRHDNKVQRYIDTHDVEPDIAEAMYDGEVVPGMTKEQVRFLLDLPALKYDCEEQKPTENTSLWVCDSRDPMRVHRYTISFVNGEVKRSNLP